MPLIDRALLALACLLMASSNVNAEVRQWTDASGKFTVQAEFVSLVDGKVTLKRPDSKKPLVIRLSRLSDDDQAFVNELLAEQSAQEEGAADGDEKVQAPKQAPGAASAPTRRVPNNVINSVRGAVYRTETTNNLRQIALALIQYESARQKFPTAAIYTRDQKPGLSWRVAILPMLDEDALYRRFKLDEPWDSPHNKALIRQMPAIYQSPGSDFDDGHTNYLAVVSPDTVIAEGNRGVRMADVRDGTSNTIMVVEADDTYAAIWTKPDDYTWDAKQPSYGLGGIWSGTFMAVLADGSVKRIPASVSVEELQALFTRSGGEPIRVPE